MPRNFSYLGNAKQRWDAIDPPNAATVLERAMRQRILSTQRGHMQRSVLFVTVGLMLAGGAAAAPKVKHRHTPTAAHVNKTLLKQRSAAPSVTADVEPFAALERVTVDADSMDMDKNGDHFVNGYVINKNAQAILFVEIVVNFFDDAGVLVDSGTADTQDLASGGVWSFQVTSPCEGITTYKIVKVIHQYRQSMHG